MMNILRNLWTDDEGQDLAEYGLLLVLVAVVVTGGIVLFRGQIVAAFSAATSALTPAA